MTVECPSQEQLHRYAIGDLDNDASDDVERHLALCSACEDSLAQCDSAEDSLMRHLPLAGALSVEAQSEPPGWLAQLRSGPLEPATPAPAPAPRVPEPAAEFSSYELLGVLGHGGMGVVYRARHRQLERLVALKVLSPRLMATAEARRRFEREIRVLGGLHHPGIVMATDANRIDGAAYLVMELIDGVDMARMVRDGGPLGVAEACEAGRQIADALAAAHRAGTIHRDIKPSNVMVDRLGRIKLLDFGLAHLTELSTESRDTSLGRLLGTLDYMAPEQADCERALDARVDLFGLGATLFYLMTGRPPHGDHSRGSLLAQLRALVAEEPPPVRTLRADVPPQLDEFISRLLSRDPAKRPESAESVARNLSTWSGGNLAARVAELRPTNAPEEEAAAASSGAIAQRSLSELLHTGLVPVPEERTPVMPRPQPKTPRRGTGRKIAAWAAAAAFVGGVLFGVTILLKTPEGTLKIESDVSNVSVELVNEQNQSHALQIQSGVNETILRAGAYRVRFAGEHEGIAIEPDRITLKRGEKTVARITRIPATSKKTASETSAARAEQKRPDSFASKVAEPLYQGTTEADWQQIFAHETSPVAKLEGAIALMTLAAELPPKAHLAKVLDVGAEIVRASFWHNVIDFALAAPMTPPTQAPRWQIKEGENNGADGRLMRRGRRMTQFQAPPDPTPPDALYGAFSRFQYFVNHHIHTIPAGLLADDLSAAVRSGPSARGAFAASLLRGPAHSVIVDDPEASSVVSQQLDVPLTGVDWTALCLIVRLNYVQNNSAAQMQSLTAAIDQLGERLRAAAVSQTTNSMRGDLLNVLKSEPQEGWPPSVQKTMAELILDSIVREHRPFDEFVRVPTAQWTQIYDPSVVAERRRVVGRLLGPSLTVANGYLKQHTTPPYEFAERQVVAWTYLPLLLYSNGDSWPADETATLLTQQLRAYYSDDPRGTTDQSVEKLLPSTPSELLTDIVRVTGEIPDFVKTGYPRSRTVATRWQQVQQAVKSGEMNSVLRNPENSLAIDDPYGAVKLAVEVEPAGQPKKFLQWFSPQELLRMAARQSSDIDPLFYLAVLTDLAGRNPAWDDNIALLVKNWRPGTDTRVGLESLVAGHTKASDHARRLLQRIAAKAKSPKLADTLRELKAALLVPRH